MSVAQSLRLNAIFISRRSRVAALFLFLGLVAVLGGGSRDDIQSLLLLRPLAVLACGYAMIVVTRAELKSIAAPLLLLMAFAALHLLHLTPLPPDLWTPLPRRDTVEQIDLLLGVGEVWRPLSLSPAKTVNSMFSLFVPLAALLLFARLEPADRGKVFLALTTFALACAVLAILQILGPPGGPLYLYSITNDNFPVGLFSNRNHLSFLLAIAIFVSLWMSANLGIETERNRVLVLLLGALLILMLPLVFVTGSRAGLGLAALSLLAGFAVVLKSDKMGRKVGLGLRRKVSGRSIALAFAVLLIAVSAATVLLARDVALARIMGSDEIGELRLLVLPILGRMIEDFGVLGAGLGSFEIVYRMYEPVSLISSRYLNEAHNDWAQILIEGGVPVALLILASLAWLGRELLKLGREALRPSAPLMPALWIILILGVASIFDYPLRVPSIAAFFAVAAAMVSTAAYDQRERMQSRIVPGDGTRHTGTSGRVEVAG